MEDRGAAWLNLKAASKYTGLGDFVLRRLVNDPEGLPHVRISGRIIISRAEIDRFLAERVQIGPGLAVNCGVSEGVQRLVAAFIDECGEVGPDRVERASELYRAFNTWAAGKRVESCGLLAQRTFGVALGLMGFVRTRGGAGRRLWRGVSLRSAIAPPCATHCAT